MGVLFKPYQNFNSGMKLQKSKEKMISLFEILFSFFFLFYSFLFSFFNFFEGKYPPDGEIHL